MKEKILISTGGSGGHVIPATTIYNHLKNEYEVAISTDLRGLKYLNINNYKVFKVDTPKLNISFLFPIKILKVFFLTLKSLFLLKKEKIQILISTGGYMSLPLCLAAKILNIKIFLLEPNMIIGRANKFFLSFCKKIICYSNKIIGFPNKFHNKLVTLNPLIRKEYYQKDLNKKNDNIFTIMIVGGSQGAKIFDKFIHTSIVKISKTNSLKIIHQTNQKNVDFFKNFYSENKLKNIVFNFDQNLDILLNQSDLCISRAGASSLAEISLLNIPFIAIPLPNSKDNHQFENAKYYKEKDCCWLIDQMDFDNKKFEALLLDILKNKDHYLKKKKNLENLNYQNTWNNVNQNLLSIINEN
jgi:UDP-N-acetylglucosamine--N-acetylmuramyl-(pentapeptide) pyrophosphoryl-undecaprenol N-acetylglucosamine transferase